MSEIGKKIVSVSPEIPASQKEQFVAGINAIASRLGICADWLFILMVTETGGDRIKPSAYNGNCGGLIQFCRGSGAKTVGYSPEAIRNMSAIAQLPLIEKYLKAVGVVRGGDLPSIYLSVLFPAYKGYPRNKRIPVPGQQSAHLYKNGMITKESLESGLIYKANHALKRAGSSIPSTKSGEILKCSTPITSGSTPSPEMPSDTSASPVQPQPTSPAGGFGGIAGTITGYIQQEWDFTVASAKVYTGGIISGVDTGSITGGESTAPSGGAVPATPVSTAPTETAPPTASAVPPPGEGTWMCPVPIDKTIFTSPFGPRWGRPHDGNDYAGAQGVPIYASKSGIVANRISKNCTSRYPKSCNPARGSGESPECSCGRRGGNYIWLKHSGGDSSVYMHLKDIMVNPGQTVKQGQQIATLGNSGSSTGPHLHFGIKLKGKYVDPYPLIDKKPRRR